MAVTPDDVLNIVHKQAADLAVMRTLIGALIQQALDIDKAIYDFGEMTEDISIQTMYSNMPETFFQEFQSVRAVWITLLQAVADSR